MYKRQGSIVAALLVALFVALVPVSGGARELVVTHVAPFGGALAAGARDFNFGAQMAFTESNATGGVNGHKFRLVSRDDGNRAAETIRLLKESLANDAPIAVIGLSGQAGIEAVQKEKLLSNAQVPAVGIRAGTAMVSDDPWMFHLRTSHRDELVKLANQLQAIFRTNIAILHEDDETGREGAKAFEEAAKTVGIKVATRATFPPNTLDFDKAISTIAAVKPDAVLISANTNASANFVKKFRPANPLTQIVITSAAEPEIIVEQIGPELARAIGLSTVVPNPNRQVVPIVRDFHRVIEKFKLKGIGRVNFSSMEGYIAARLVIDAVKRISGNPDGAALLRSLDSARKVDLGGYIVEFDASKRNRAAFAELVLIGRDGKVLQ
jgi:branched-chain amino acid transport system substrate-binding protein